MSNAPIKVAIVDDDTLVVELLKQLLEETDQLNVEVVCTAEGVNEFLEKLKQEKPPIDIVLLDLKMKKEDGFQILHYLKAIDSPIRPIILTSYYKLAYIGQMVEQGASAFLAKEMEKEELFRAIQIVYDTGYYYTPEQHKKLSQQITPRKPNLAVHPSQRFTEREIEVLRLIAQQYTTKEIAQQLFLSPKTIEAHKSNLMSKSGTRNTAGLLMYAIQHNIIDPNDVTILD